MMKKLFVPMAQPNPSGRAAIKPSLHLVCVPFAGSRAGAFNALRTQLGTDAQFHELVYPKERGHSNAAVGFDDMVASLDALVDSLEGDVVLLGYSMGALVALEAARRSTRARCQIIHLIVAACRAPHEFDSGGLSLIKSDEEFLKRIAGFGCLPKSFEVNQQLYRRNLATLRADLAICDRYEATSRELVKMPLTVIGGLADDFVPAETLDRWSAYSSIETHIYALEGGHFFYRNDTSAVMHIVRGCLQRRSRQQAALSFARRLAARYRSLKMLPTRKSMKTRSLGDKYWLDGQTTQNSP